jgi:hypothetical protein
LLGVASAVLFLAVLSAFGMVALRRIAPVLTPLETVAYGAPLGAVLGTMVTLLLARVIGLTGATVAVSAVALAAALVGHLTRPSGGNARPLRDHLLSVLHRSRRQPAMYVAFGVVGLVVVRWAIFWSGALIHTDSGLVAMHVNVFGDLPVHMGNAAAFAFGDNFPPQHPRFAGHPLAYHHLTDLTAASLIPLGMDPGGALALHSLVFSGFAALAIFAFSLRLTRDATTASVALALFAMAGSLGWIVMLDQFQGAADPAGGRLWAFEAVREAGYVWQNMFYGFVMPQRAFLYGLPLAFLALTLILIAQRSASPKLFAIAGAVLGLLPLAHLATMLALALVTPFLVLLFPTKRWIYFFAAWILIALPQLILQQGGGPGALGFIRIQLGWVMGTVPWPLFWLKQVGLFLPLVVAALALPRLLPRDSYRMLAAFMGIFVITNVVVFQPWDWDSHKLLVYWFFATCVLVAALLVWAWRRHGALTRTLIAAAVLTMVLSGVLEDMNQLLGRDWYPLFTREEIMLAARVREETPPDAVFATGAQNNHPVPVLAGRKVLMGYPGWLFAEGLPWQERQADLRAIYSLGADAEELLEEYSVDYVVIGPNERESMAANAEAFRSRYRSVIVTESYEVFAVALEP